MRGIPKETYGLAFVAAGIIAGACLFAYSGPYRVVADLQIALFHTNIVNISVLVTLAIVAAPLCAIVFALEKRFGTRETWFTPIWNNLDRGFDLPPGKMLMVGVTFAVMGAYFAVKDLAAGPLIPLSVRDLEDGRVPHGTYVDLIDGTVIEDANIRFRSNSNTYHYHPVFDHADPPVLFVRVSERSTIRDANGHIRGILDAGGLEGELQSQLRSSNALGDRHYVLGAGRVPNPNVGYGFATLGLVLSVIGLFWWRVKYAPGDASA